MLLIIYAVLLVCFWILALRIKPEHYPKANPEAVIAWKAYRLRLYRRYAALIVIWIMLTVASSYLIDYGKEHQAAPVQRFEFVFGILAVAYIVIIIGYAGYNCFRNLQIKRELKYPRTRSVEVSPKAEAQIQERLQGE